MRKKIISCLLLILLLSSISAAAAKVKSLNKNEVIKLGLQNSEELAKLRQEVEIAQAKLRKAESGFYPTVDLAGSYTRLGDPPTRKVPIGAKEPQKSSKIYPLAYKEIEPSANTYSLKLSLQQPLYLGGQLWLGLEQAEKNLTAAKLKLSQKRREVTYQILEQYYSVLKAEKMLKVAQQRLEQAQNFVEVAKANKQVGRFTKTDLLKAKVNRTRAQQSILRAKNGLQMAKLALKNKLGITTKVKLKLKEDLVKKEVEQMTIETAYQYALEHRVQLQLLNLQKKQLQLSLQQAKNSKWRPSINLMGNYQKQGSGFDNFTGAEGDWQLTVAFNYNLFSGGRKQAKVEKLNHQLTKFAASKKQAKEGIKLAVRQTSLSLSEAEQRIELTRLNLQKAKENLEQIKLKYQEGLVTTSDVLATQTTLREVKTDYYQAIYDYNLAAAKLDKVLGKPIVAKEGIQ